MAVTTNSTRPTSQAIIFCSRNSHSDWEKGEPHIITMMAASVSGSTDSVTSVMASLSFRPGVSMMVTPFLQ